MNKSQTNYWENFYKQNVSPYHESKFCYFIKNHSLFKSKKYKLLDCGCGNGRDSYSLSNHFEVVGIDTSFKPEDKTGCTFKIANFCSYDKKDYDIIYSRFTFHSISNQQQIMFLQSIKKGCYLCIETRSNKSSQIKKVFGDEHFRNYTDYNILKKILTENNFKIIYLSEDKGFAPYKNEDPICIRVICEKQ